jgi:hypothetical protein
MHLRLAALGLALAASPAAAADPACTGTVSGAFKATFECTAVARDLGDGTSVVQISLSKPVEGLHAVTVGAWIVPGEPAVRTYAFGDLGPGRASAILDKEGVLYAASKTTGERGEATLTLKSVKKLAQPPGTFKLSGTYRVRMPSPNSTRTDEMVIEARF